SVGELDHTLARGNREVVAALRANTQIGVELFVLVVRMAAAAGGGMLALGLWLGSSMLDRHVDAARHGRILRARRLETQRGADACERGDVVGTCGEPAEARDRHPPC